MEDVLEVYARPYDPAYPQICLDEKRKKLRDTPRANYPLRQTNLNGRTTTTPARAALASCCGTNP